MIKAIVNDTHTLEIADNKGHILLDNEPFAWDVSKISDKDFHILKDNKSYHIEVVEANYIEKIFRLKIGDTIHTVNLKDRTDLLLEKMGLGSSKSTRLNELKAPMPGLIYEMKVQVGDEVKKGDILLILVAMKMENAIKAAGDGKVKAIKVKTGETVEKNHIIIEFE